MGRDMASRAIIDERGRLQIPRAEREKALIPPNSEVVVIPRSPGHLELVLVGEARLERFQKRVKGRLKGWREDEHKADAQLLKELRASPKRDGPMVSATEDTGRAKPRKKTQWSVDHDKILYSKP